MTTPLILRSQVNSLTALTANDLRLLWARIEQMSPDLQAQALHDLVPALIEMHGAAAGALSADWYDETRSAAGASGSFEAVPAPVARLGANELVGWALTTGQTPEGVFGLLSGGATRRVANVARETVMTASVDDEGARGWKRAGRGGCGFCQMLIGRGAVYSEASADFRSHDSCHCVAVPAFKVRSSVVVGSERRTPSARFGAEFGLEPAATDKTALRAYWAARQASLPVDFKGERLESHEVRFVERFLNAGESLEWIARNARGRATPGNDFRWLSNGGVEVELKSTKARYETIRGSILGDASKAGNHRWAPLSKTRYIVDLEGQPLTAELLRGLRRYNVGRKKWRLTDLWVMSNGSITTVRLRP